MRRLICVLTVASAGLLGWPAGPVAVAQGKLDAPAKPERRVRQFGNTVYEVPDGFRKGRSDAGWVVLYPADPRAPFSTMRVYGGAARADLGKLTLREFADRQMASDLKADERTATQPPEEKKVAVAGRPALFLSRLTKKRGQYAEVYVAVELRTRFELFRVECPLDGAAEATAARKVTAQFAALVEASRFVSEGAKPPLGEPAPGALAGVWWGGGLQIGVGIDGMMRTDFVTGTFTFFPDGRFAAGVPETGLGKLDFRRAVLADAATVGNYRLDGKTLRLEYADGETDDLEYTGDTIIDGAKRLTACELPPDGFRFDGTKRSTFYQGLAPGIGQGGVSAWSSATFKADGTFELEGGSAASATFDAGGGYALNGKNGASGKYAVKNGRVELRATDGKVIRRWVILLSKGAEGQKSKTRVIVDGDFIEGKVGK